MGNDTWPVSRQTIETKVLCFRDKFVIFFDYRFDSEQVQRNMKMVHAKKIAVIGLCLNLIFAGPVFAGAITANGWYEEEEIYYILGGVEARFTELGDNQLYLIGGDRTYQANLALFIPGERGYSPHWNVNVVHTASGKTLTDILSSPYVSEHYPEALFDDAADVMGAVASGLVYIEQPGVVVLCPVISVKGAEAPGNTELSEDFPAFPEIF